VNSKDRFKRMREVESFVSKLVRKGWHVDAVVHTDEDREPFKTEIHLSVESKSAVEGKL